MLNVFEEISDTSRRLILAELRTGNKNVSDLCQSTGLKQSNVSNHLGRMRQRGIVRAKKVGREVFYALATPEVEAIVCSIFNSKSTICSGVKAEEWVKTYAKSAVAGDENACGDLLDDAFRAHLPLIDIYQDLLAPAMTMIGNWWKVSAIDEAQEHMASEITQRIMARASHVAGPMRRCGRVAVLGCAPNCWHVIGLRMISDFLRMHGWKTLFLGANVPVKSFVSTVHNHQPQLVLLSINSPEGVADTLTTIRTLSESRTRKVNFEIGVGGTQAGMSPDSYLEAGADFLAQNLKQFATDILPRLESDTNCRYERP